MTESVLAMATEDGTVGEARRMVVMTTTIGRLSMPRAVTKSPTAAIGRRRRRAIETMARFSRSPLAVWNSKKRNGAKEENRPGGKREGDDERRKK